MAIVLYVGGSKDGEKGVVPYGFSKSRADTALGPEFYTERFMELQGVGKVRLMARKACVTRSSCSAPPATTADLRNTRQGAPTIARPRRHPSPGPVRARALPDAASNPATPLNLAPCQCLVRLRRGLPEWGLPVMRHRPEAMHDAKNAQSALAQQIAQTIADEIGAQSARCAPPSACSTRAPAFRSSRATARK